MMTDEFARQFCVILFSHSELWENKIIRKWPQNRRQHSKSTEGASNGKSRIIQSSMRLPFFEHESPP